MVDSRMRPNAIVPLPIKFECKASFLPTQNQSCPICLEATPETRSYVICQNNHTTCEACVKSILKTAAADFRVVNGISRASSKDPFQVVAEKGMLPKCPMRCAIPSHITVSIKTNTKWTPAQVTWINYAPGETITVTPSKILSEQNNTLLGTLSDGTTVSLPDNTLDVALNILEAQKPISATILTKTVESGRVYLKCSSEALAASPSYLGKKVEVLIKDLHGELNVPRGYLEDSIWVNFYGVNASIGDHLSGYVCEEKRIFSDMITVLQCTPYQEEEPIQLIANKSSDIRPAAHPHVIFGTLEDGKTLVVFHLDPEIAEHPTYQVGQLIPAVIRKIIIGTDPATGNPSLCLICSSKDYPIEIGVMPHRGNDSDCASNLN